MRFHTLECETKTPLSLRETFSFFEDPGNLAEITPPWLNFRVVSPGVVMRKGAEIDYVIRWKGLPLRWKTLISEYEPPFVFVDEQVRGPYALWRHRHSFHPAESGTTVSDRVEYALPFGFLGEAAHAILVRRQLEEIFRYRQSRLAEIFANLQLG